MDFNSKHKSSEIEEILDSVGGKADKSSLAAVATSGSYNDLTNKPFNSFDCNKECIHVSLDDSVCTIPITDSYAYIKHIKGIEYDYEKVDLSTVGIKFITEFGEGDWEIHKRGDGTKFLSDDGTYKEVSGGSSSGGSERTPVVIYPSQYIEALEPNVIAIIPLPIQSLYIEDFVTSLSRHDEYTIIFSTALEEPEAPRMTLPDYIRWANGSIPTLEWHTVYEFSITKDFINFMPEGELTSVGQNIFKAVLTPFKPAE